MKFCKNCGNQIDDNAIFCSYCGARANGENTSNNYGGYNPYGGYRPYGNTFGSYPVYDMRPSRLMTVISFFFWPVGIFAWLFNRRRFPGSANSALRGAVAGISFSMPLLGFVFWLLGKEDECNREYMRWVRIFTIAGAVAWVALIGLMLLGAFTLSYTDFIGVETVVPDGDMAAFIHTIIG